MTSGSVATSGSRSPSGFSRDVPRAVREVVRIARQHIALPVEGERGAFRLVVGGIRVLQDELGDDHDRTTRRKVAAAEAWGLMRRSGHTRALQVYVHARPEDVALVVLRANVSGVGACSFCGGATAGDGTWCTSCQPAMRRDRAWRASAVNLLHEGKSIASIAAVLGQQLYPGPGDGPLVGVVAHLLAEAPALVPKAYRDGLRAAVGKSVPKIDSVLSARSRKRRARRQESQT